jgi:hypothetical protein
MCGMGIRIVRGEDDEPALARRYRYPVVNELSFSAFGNVIQIHKCGDDAIMTRAIVRVRPVPLTGIVPIHVYALHVGEANIISLRVII